MRNHVLILAAILGLSSFAWADTIELRDGRNIQGTLDGEEGSNVRVKQNDDGLITVILIPKSNIYKVVPSRAPASAPATAPAVAPSPASLPALAPPASAPTPATAPAPAAPAAATAPSAGPVSHGHFFHEWLAMGHIVPHDNLVPLSAADQKTFDDLVTLYRRKAPPKPQFKELLALAAEPGASPYTLSILSYDAVGMGLGEWLATLRWAVLQAERTRTGVFKTDDVLDAEKPYLAADCKAAFPDALQQISAYMPDPTDSYFLQRKNQEKMLQQINVGNCLDVKDKALWAAMLLDGQLKLIPDLSDDDQAVLKQRNAEVHAIIAQCYKYDAKARAELAKQTALQHKSQTSSDAAH